MIRYAPRNRHNARDSLHEATSSEGAQKQFGPHGQVLLGLLGLSKRSGNMRHREILPSAVCSLQTTPKPAVSALTQKEVRHHHRRYVSRLSSKLRFSLDCVSVRLLQTHTEALPAECSQTRSLLTGCRTRHPHQG